MTIVEQLSESQSRVAALEGEMKIAAEKALVDGQSLAAAVEAKAKIEESMKAMTEAHAKAMTDATEAQAKLQAALAMAKSELEKTRAALANPAFADAAIVGRSETAQSGMPPAEEAPLTHEAALKKYCALENPRERAEFRKANWKILGINEEK